jgi:hypothetical protein
MKIETSKPPRPSSHADRDKEAAQHEPPSLQNAGVYSVPTTGRDDMGEPYVVQVAVDTRPAYSALAESQRSFLLIVASLAATISPASTTTYYPALTSLARDLSVSVTLINLTISTYQVNNDCDPDYMTA